MNQRPQELQLAAPHQVLREPARAQEEAQLPRTHRGVDPAYGARVAGAWPVREVDQGLTRREPAERDRLAAERADLAVGNEVRNRRLALRFPLRQDGVTARRSLSPDPVADPPRRPCDDATAAPDRPGADDERAVGRPAATPQRHRAQAPPVERCELAAPVAKDDFVCDRLVDREVVATQRRKPAAAQRLQLYAGIRLEDEPTLRRRPERQSRRDHCEGGSHSTIFPAAQAGLCRTWGQACTGLSTAL